MHIPNLQTILQKLKPGSHEEFRTISEKASHDWKRMVLAFSFLSLLTIGGGLYMFLLIVQGKLFQGYETQPSVIKNINQKDLDTVIEFFGNRKQIFDGLGDRGNDVSDPSL